MFRVRSINGDRNRGRGRSLTTEKGKRGGEPGLIIINSLAKNTFTGQKKIRFNTAAAGRVDYTVMYIFLRRIRTVLEHLLVFPSACLHSDATNKINWTFLEFITHYVFDTRRGTKKLQLCNDVFIKRFTEDYYNNLFIKNRCTS